MAIEAIVREVIHRHIVEANTAPTEEVSRLYQEAAQAVLRGELQLAEELVTKAGALIREIKKRPEDAEDEVASSVIPALLGELSTYGIADPPLEELPNLVSSVLTSREESMEDVDAEGRIGTPHKEKRKRQTRKLSQREYDEGKALFSATSPQDLRNQVIQFLSKEVVRKVDQTEDLGNVDQEEEKAIGEISSAAKASFETIIQKVRAALKDAGLENEPFPFSEERMAPLMKHQNTYYLLGYISNSAFYQGMTFEQAVEKARQNIFSEQL